MTGSSELDLNLQCSNDLQGLIPVVRNDRSAFDEPLQAKVREYERGFQVHFSRFAIFSQSIFTTLHHNSSNIFNDGRVHIASREQPSIEHDIDILTRIANQKSLIDGDREQYIGALRRIYANLPHPSRGTHPKASTLFVGPEREGRYIGHLTGFFESGSKTWYPNAKRIPHNGGVIVAHDEPTLRDHYECCVLVDGAIASGATLITLLSQLNDHTSNFYIYSAHSTAEGARAITCFADHIGLNLSLVIGHVTTGLDEHLYARRPGDPSKLVVGDLGDMIFGRPLPKCGAAALKSLVPGSPFGKRSEA